MKKEIQYKDRCCDCANKISIVIEKNIKNGKEISSKWCFFCLCCFSQKSKWYNRKKYNSDDYIYLNGKVERRCVKDE